MTMIEIIFATIIGFALGFLIGYIEGKIQGWNNCHSFFHEEVLPLLKRGKR